MPLNQPFQVIGFHSCDKAVGLKILNGDDQLRPSTNQWDWLGSGIYFWEQNPKKALDYAEKCQRKEQKFNGNIQVPFIIGAIIELGNCLNLVEPNSLQIVKAAYDQLYQTHEQAEKAMPRNNGANRKLDCAVIQSIHASNKAQELPPYDTVRSPFHEDEPIYETSNFTHGLHIEICVINEDMIKGYFLPRPLEAYNPYL